MREKYLGDSFDIVKRFWAERLASVAPLYAHPRFVPKNLRPAFESMTGMPIAGTHGTSGQQFGLFLDPHTGIPLPSEATQRVSASHAPLAFIAAEMNRLGPLYLICFDQSHKRVSGLSRADQRERKRAALSALDISSFYYVSHAPFLFAARQAEVLDQVRSRLRECGIPCIRFEPPGPDGRGSAAKR